MKEYKLENIVNDEGLFKLGFMGDKQFYDIHVIENHPGVNKEALKMLHSGIIFLIEGQDGDNLEELSYNGIKSIYTKVGNIPVYLSKEGYTKKKTNNEKSYTIEDSDNTLLS